MKLVPNRPPIAKGSKPDLAFPERTAVAPVGSEPTLSATASAHARLDAEEATFELRYPALPPGVVSLDQARLRRALSRLLPRV